MRPVRVVAPASVKRGRSSRIDRADGPLPITMSSWKSSIAGYSTSSTARGSRWTSSMKSTSPSSRLVRMAARSPARSSAGPLVTRRLTPSSAATIPASDVLPVPGGPAKSRWSTAWPRCFAAPSRISRCSLSRSWPTNSSSRRGRRVVSSARPIGSAAGLSSSSLDTGDRQELQRVAQQVLDRPVVGELGEDVAYLVGLVAETRQRGPHLGAARRRRRGGVGVLERRDLEAGLELDQQPLGGAFPDARHEGQGVEVVVDQGAAEDTRRVARQDRQRQLGTDAVRPDEHLERVALVA